MLLDFIHKLPIGYSEVLYAGSKYGLTRTDFNSGNSIKVYAKELGGTNFISLNYYITSSKELLKPCEMSEQKVIHFLKNLSLIPLG
ncbi:peptide methionine sulfoxide reductase [uncultured Cyclobacterium sp.]|uniref:peptide methionine sulfoxide reductase n=1 Tax=uncultured Cyclobacterium sp. TaxID=453820 RepID=UPI0030EE59F4|tara:strand:- start:413827 stop:414084 length:258 start_codon:yes stop_codon:yes gene_type:complete